MKKHLLLVATLLLTLNVAHAKKTKKKSVKMSREDARELCLSTSGAGIKEKALKKCISKVMRTGKI